MFFFLCSSSIIISTLAQEIPDLPDPPSIRRSSRRPGGPDSPDFPDFPEPPRRERSPREERMRNRFDPDSEEMDGGRERNMEEMRHRMRMEHLNGGPDDRMRDMHSERDMPLPPYPDVMNGLHERREDLNRRKEELQKKYKKDGGHNAKKYDDEKKKLKEAMRELHDELREKEHMHSRSFEGSRGGREDRKGPKSMRDQPFPPMDHPLREKREAMKRMREREGHPEMHAPEDSIRDVRASISKRRIDKLWTMAQEASFSETELADIRKELDEFIEMEKEFAPPDEFLW
eukprot:CAMPEP_0185791106 /NCGR_PEP_ID=MMETSP1174-20130828/158188_1 /TAXON_ID=35687 /ORGANISM="Dictyocha speculum, Strain CCMP1381" /LENGTH=287 /DNA_ID=CAMNT_0028486011 /DNA_START=80 /DNA_END=940 /DNA_ORIENTATION=+